jgi:hypothetical protein
MTPREADAEVAKYGPVDLAYELKYAAEHDVEPVWRAALARAAARERRQTARVLKAVGEVES